MWLKLDYSAIVNEKAVTTWAAGNTIVIMSCVIPGS